MFSPYGSVVLKALIQALSLFFRLPRSSTYSTGCTLTSRGCGLSVENVGTVLFGPSRPVFCWISLSYGY